MTDRTVRTAKSLMWSGAEAGGLTILSFGALIFYSHLLSPSQIGIYAVALSTIEIIGVGTGMLFHDALVRKPTATIQDFDGALSLTVALGTSVSIILFVVAGVVSQSRGASPVWSVLAWMGLSLPFGGLSAVLAAQYRREFEFRALALRSFSGRLAGAILGIIAALCGAGVWSLVVQQLTMAITGACVLLALTGRRPVWLWRWDGRGALVNFGVMAVTGLLLSFSVKRIFTVLVAATLGLRAAGYLNIAFRTVDAVWSLTATAAGQVFLPLMARYQSDGKRLIETYVSAAQLGGAVLYPCFVGMSAVAPDLVGVTFGAKWAPSRSLLAAVSLLALLQWPKLLCSSALTAIGRPREPVVWVVIQMAVLLLGFLVFPVSKPSDAVGIWCFGEILTLPVALWFLRSRVGVRLIDQAKALWVPLVCSLAMLVVVFGLRGLPGLMREQPVERLLTLIFAGGVGYISTFYILDVRTIYRLVTLLRTAVAPR